MYVAEIPQFTLQHDLQAKTWPAS